MKSFLALCLFGAAVSAMAMPQEMHNHQQVGGPRPPGPQVHPAPPHRPPTHEIDPEFDFDMNAELWEFIGHVNDFVQMWPKNEIRQIVRSHMSDPELRATLDFIQSPRFEEIVRVISETPEAQAIERYIGEANWPWIKAEVFKAVRNMEVQGLFGNLKWFFFSISFFYNLNYFSQRLPDAAPEE